MWDATFQDGASHQNTATEKSFINPKIYEHVTKRTPGYSSWQGNKWIFSNTDAMLFLGEVVGKDMLAENNPKKISAVLSTLNKRDSWTQEELKSLIHGGQPSVYLFYDRQNDSYHAYEDFS